MICVVLNLRVGSWTGLKAEIAGDGLGNSLLIAFMPTASTSRILGFDECFEPYTRCVLCRCLIAADIYWFCFQQHSYVWRRGVALPLLAAPVISSN